MIHTSILGGFPFLSEKSNAPGESGFSPGALRPFHPHTTNIKKGSRRMNRASWESGCLLASPPR
ncbi:MAG TPA: hypothetical protein VFV38_52185 [Ktedonobacteraceae bacterium]|nr:hypothetical protein [Ktedonobacteraceae bacterium]